MKTRLEELREKLRKVNEVADTCVARETDPKDVAEHERWRASWVAELQAEIAKAEAEIAEAARPPTLASVWRDAHRIGPRRRRS